jgi:azurin
MINLKTLNKPNKNNMKKLLLVFALITSVATTTFAQSPIHITIESSDQMKYNLSQIKVKAGQKVMLHLKHVGKMPIQAMGHNLVILQKGTDIVEFARLASNAKASGYVPTGSKAVIAATKLVGGGQETSITFIAPAKGTYDFICTFPGHFSMMKGKLIVE